MTPERQKSMTAQIDAKTTMLPTGHMTDLSNPSEVAKVIEEIAAIGLR